MEEMSEELKMLNPFMYKSKFTSFTLFSCFAHLSLQYTRHMEKLANWPAHSCSLDTQQMGQWWHPSITDQ